MTQSGRSIKSLYHHHLVKLCADLAVFVLRRNNNSSHRENTSLWTSASETNPGKIHSVEKRIGGDAQVGKVAPTIPQFSSFVIVSIYSHIIIPDRIVNWGCDFIREFQKRCGIVVLLSRELKLWRKSSTFGPPLWIEFVISMTIPKYPAIRTYTKCRFKSGK